VLDAKAMYKSGEELKKLFESKGITPDKTVIVFCETSVRASTLFLALKGLGYPKVKVYDGAYIEWQATSDNKVE
jgi:thiosulfate/3-mercaptopyruvate sulfurtransferase